MELGWNSMGPASSSVASSLWCFILSKLVLRWPRTWWHLATSQCCIMLLMFLDMIANTCKAACPELYKTWRVPPANKIYNLRDFYHQGPLSKCISRKTWRRALHTRGGFLWRASVNILPLPVPSFSIHVFIIILLMSPPCFSWPWVALTLTFACHCFESHWMARIFQHSFLAFGVASWWIYLTYILRMSLTLACPESLVNSLVKSFLSTWHLKLLGKLWHFFRVQTTWLNIQRFFDWSEILWSLGTLWDRACRSTETVKGQLWFCSCNPLRRSCVSQKCGDEASQGSCWNSADILSSLCSFREAKEKQWWHAICFGKECQNLQAKSLNVRMLVRTYVSPNCVCVCPSIRYSAAWQGHCQFACLWKMLVHMSEHVPANACAYVSARYVPSHVTCCPFPYRSSPWQTLE